MAAVPTNLPGGLGMVISCDMDVTPINVLKHVINTRCMQASGIATGTNGDAILLEEF